MVALSCQTKVLGKRSIKRSLSVLVNFVPRGPTLQDVEYSIFSTVLDFSDTYKC